MVPDSYDGFGPVSLVLFVLYFLGKHLYLFVLAHREARRTEWANRQALDRQESQAQQAAWERLTTLCDGDSELLELCGLTGEHIGNEKHEQR